VYRRLIDAIRKRVVASMRRSGVVHFGDSTLRDGEQAPGAALDTESRVRVAQALEALGVDSIEAGFPASSREELEGVRAVARAVRSAVVAAFCRTVPADIDAAKEALAERSLRKRAAILCIATSPLHRTKNLGMTKAQVIRAAVEAVRYAQPDFQLVTLGAEDASRTEPDFLAELYREAIQAGAVVVGFTDTIGRLLPTEAADWVRRIQDAVPELDRACLAVHFHNDLGLATANTLAALEAGADIAQVTLGGVGERAGNAALEEVAVALAVRGDRIGRRTRLRLERLLETCRLHARLTGLEPGPSKAVVGPNAFRTEAGMHQDGLLKDPILYEPFPPSLVGAGGWQIVLGRHSGRRGLRHRLRAIGVEPSDEELDRFFERFKAFAAGRREVTDADLRTLWSRFAAETTRSAS